ncbi:MAG: hypothetical protein JSV42_10245 [Chloroflexota bacterium]|nr:MAG: hypothetical protein JSV42_10245 [Chloroflexota bacterium]
MKGEKPAELVQVIWAVAGGQALFSLAIAAWIMRFFADQRIEFRDTVPEETFPKVTSRVMEVFNLIA